MNWSAGLANRIASIKTLVSMDIRSVVDTSFEGEKAVCKDVIYHHFGWNAESGGKGKMLRPVLVMLVCNALGGKSEDGLPAASAIELIHNFSLIHDDIEDHDPIRHGRQTAWKRYGIPQAINAGDALIGMAFGRLSRSKHAASIISCSHLSATLVNLTKGQSLDLDSRADSTFGLGHYWDIVDNKTGCLIAESLRLGANSAGADKNVASQLYNYGILIGRAFQIRDDLQGIWGRVGQTGKTSGIDLLNHKKTYPVLLSLEADADFKKIWMKENLTRFDIRNLVRIMKNNHIEELAVGHMLEQLRLAQEILQAQYRNHAELKDIEEFISITFNKKD